MKKILLIIAITLLMFQMVVLAIAIDMGATAIDRDSAAGATYTLVDKTNSANGTGIITSVEIWAMDNLSNCEVAIFYVVSGNNLSTRDTEVIGSVTGGSKQTFVVNLNVQEGDYLGMYWSAGVMEQTDGSGGYWYFNGDAIPCTNEAFSITIQGSALSLYGTGATVGWDHKWNTKEISKWNTKEIVKWNAIE